MAIRYPIGADMVLEIKLTGGATFLDCGEGVTSFGQALSTEKEEFYFMNKRGGATTIPKIAKRSFKVTGQKVVGDPLQDAIFAHEFKFGADTSCTYNYYDSVTKKGETGAATIVINSDGDGEANNRLKFDFDVVASGVPTTFTKTP